LHGFDALTPAEEVLSTLDTLVCAGKIRYVGVSNFSGWHIMNSLAAADRYGYPRYVANQTRLRLAIVGPLRGTQVMKYRKLDNTGMDISSLGLGMMYFGDKTPEQEAFRILDAFIEAGGNLIGQPRIPAPDRASRCTNGYPQNMRNPIVIGPPSISSSGLRRTSAPNQLKSR